MTVSALDVGTGRILAAESVVERLGAGVGGDPSVFPIRLPPDAPLPAITVNRIFERDAHEGGHVVGLVMTCLAVSVQEMEGVASVLIEAINGTEDFDFADLVDIGFNKAGSDVTGFDAERGAFMRAVEFYVEW